MPDAFPSQLMSCCQLLHFLSVAPQEELNTTAPPTYHLPPITYHLPPATAPSSDALCALCPWALTHANDFNEFCMMMTTTRTTWSSLLITPPPFRTHSIPPAPPLWAELHHHHSGYIVSHLAPTETMVCVCVGQFGHSWSANNFGSPFDTLAENQCVSN